MWVLRRFVVAPAMIGLTLAIWVTLPVWLIAAAALSPVLPGRWRALRLLWMLVVYLSLESVTLVVLLGLWLASGFGRRIRTPYFEGIHYDLIQGLMWVLFAEARRVLALQIVTDGPSPDAHPGKPLIVACRHAGPGDSFTLIHALMDWYDREPRVVLKNTMAWDPMIDVVLHRIPARFISTQPRRGHDLDSQIAALAAGLDENDAFVIFPEGGNFTPERRRRGIERLRKLGLERMAQRAEQMTHVLAPKPGGLLAAMDAAPEADVVLVAHTGLDHLVTVRDLWRELPMDKILVMRWWQVARDEIPADRDARIDWLFGWWEQIDTWVEANRPQDLPRVSRRQEAATP
ncbi:MAG TPA: 1-acyl-sn-glycerol-3-phosphate acyltransferase [Nocardioides sp.]|jgi:1-acyl-sn-glycerol-3-phosphate acyltransferase|nr:1-acyl-sn-glycerol-3-phosphate acyltransferase [Nocardioides sp.]